MFSPLECSVNARLTDGCELKRQQLSGRPGFGSLSKILKKLFFSRRHATNRHWCYGLMCRLPILALWTLIVIIVLYKSISNTSPYDENENLQKIIGQASSSKIEQSQIDHWLTEDNNKNINDHHGQLPESILGDTKSARSINQVEQIIQATKATVVTSNYEQLIEHAALKQSTFQTDPTILTTKKSITSDYSRRSDVFILLVKDEELRSDTFTHLNHATKSSASDKYASISQDDLGRHHISVPNHIRHLTDILNWHKIGYTIDTTRFGLPETLLLNERRHSVIIVDDFVKYTKLSRWVRDQFDRHCRSHNVGVLTFLPDTSNGPLLDQREILRSSMLLHHRFDDHKLQQRSATTQQQQQQQETTSNSKNGFQTLGDQFPISFKVVKQECNKNSTNCLVDYQINERTPLLRVLKRKPDFILRGELSANVNQMTYVIMSSNHVSYEPVSWARFRQVRNRRHANRQITPKKRRRRIRNETRSGKLVAPRGTQNSYYNGNGGGGERKIGVTSVRLKRAALQLHQSTQLDFSEGVEVDGDLQLLSTNSTRADDGSDLLLVESDNQGGESELAAATPTDRQVLIMLDRGLYDGIKRVIFGCLHNNWLDRILLLDTIEHLSSGDIMTPLERFVQIDVDDIFVGEQGTRLNVSDVDSMIAKQRQFASFIEGFRFNLGFSGKFFQRGNEMEKLGDEYLISRANEFTWFCHFYSHAKAHLFNDTDSLGVEITKNLHFAREKRLPLIGYNEDQLEQFFHQFNETTSAQLMPPTYAVAPHHSGVYPVHEQLFEVWRALLNVQVTSTEEYPHLRPVSARRAFVHKTIKVLPRQTCGLYTHTIFSRKYPGGFGKLLASIRGGELFETVLHNPVNIYMTHMSNYANDRLALFTFSKLFDFVRENTNLKLRYAPSGMNSGKNNNNDNNLGPNFLAQYYFALNPNERDEPLWTNPCDDRRHLAIWSAQKHHYCNRTPSVLIVGPQKTGTTALYTFLKLNRQFESSRISKQDFEEVQFFNDKHYAKGVDWYFEQFQMDDYYNSTLSESNMRFFDKSATYFDDPRAPRRAFALLPGAQIVTILINPADRAYSWYQHIKAHGDLAANRLTFEQLLAWGSENSTSTTTTIGGSQAEDHHKLDKAARALRQRCLHPGYFASHLMNWLNFYPTRQVIIIDGDWFKYNPAAVMNKLQSILRVRQPLDYNKLLVYNEQKGFYCYKIEHLQQGEDIKCLGSNKGRKYQSMSKSARAYLDRFYWQHNRQLTRLLYEIGQPLPAWLEETVNL